MLQLFKFFANNRVSLLFVMLEFIAFGLIIQNHSYHQSKYLNSANFFSGFILKKSSAIKDYFNLNSQNIALAKENSDLKNQLEKFKKSKLILSDSTVKYSYIQAKVIDNSYRKINNILMIDKGENDGIKKDMGVILPRGIVGIVLNTSKKYATILSLLNSQSKINAKVKKTHHYGSLEWNGKDYTKIQLIDLPIQAKIQKGDTIISGGKSILFPEGILIGTIDSFEIKDKSYSNINISLFEDFSALNYVYIIKNKDLEEQLILQKKSVNE